MNPNIFSIVPIEVCMDKRLTLEQLRVLVTLLSFRAKNTDVVFPTRKQIADRCGMHESNISSATTRLVELGWLEKDGLGGHSRATRYRITVPETTIAEQATVAQSATVAEQATPPLAESATRKPLADSATRKEHTSNTRGTDKLVAQQFSPPIDAQLLSDWMAVRKEKRAGKVTATVWSGLSREASRAGITEEQAVRICCERGWQGFNADWNWRASPVAKQTRHDAQMDVMEQLRRMKNGENPKVIDVTPRREIEGYDEGVRQIGYGVR